MEYISADTAFVCFILGFTTVWVYNIRYSKWRKEARRKEKIEWEANMVELSEFIKDLPETTIERLQQVKDQAQKAKQKIKDAHDKQKH